MRIVPGNEALFTEYYGTIFKPSMRVYFLLNDAGKPIGATGFIRKSKGTMVIFSEGKEEAYKDKRAVVRFANAMMRVADENGWTLIADRDTDKATSDVFLTHLGFEPDEDGVYIRWQVSQQRYRT